MEAKTCRRCRFVKPLEEFHRNRKTADGRSPECADCATRRVREYQEKKKAEDPEGWYRKQREAMKRFRDERGDEQVEYDRKQGRAYAKAMSRLRESHPVEFQALYAEAKREEGL